MKGIISSCLVLCAAISSACQIAITNVQMCNAAGVVTPWSYTQSTYGVRVSWTVTGTPTAPYAVKFVIGDVTATTSAIFGGGTGSANVSETYPSLLPVPVTVTIDPGKVSGNTTPLTATMTKTFTATPPTTAVANYSPQVLFGKQTMSVPVTTGTVTKLVFMLGEPVTQTFQSVTSVASTGTVTVSQPTHYPVFQTILSNAGPGTYSISSSFKITASNVACNLGLINPTWAQIDALKTQFGAFLGPEQNVETADPNIIAFTNASLPANYRTVLTPLQVSERLFQAVVKAITYQTPAPSGDATGVFNSKLGDCGGMSHLYNACLRIVGIPSRITCGWAIGASIPHCWSELYLPGPGWIPADTSFSRLFSPACSSFEYFAYTPGSNNHCSVARGGAFNTPALSCDFLQVGVMSIANVGTSPTVGPTTTSFGLSTTPLP